MRLADIEQRARGLSIKDTWKYSKKELIQLIQKAEGNQPCFPSTDKSCTQQACCWKPDCIH